MPSSAFGTPKAAGQGLAFAYKYAILTGSTSDSLVDSAWTKRTLDTKLYDPDGIVSVASSIFTLGKGTYYITASAAESRATAGGYRTQLKIRNTSDSTNDVIGLPHTLDYSGSPNETPEKIHHCTGIVTIASSKTFQLQHWSYTGGVGAPIGGYSANSGLNPYAQVTITQIA